MHRVLIITPHFPPDNNAGTHRVRLLAPHLSVYGWEPTVVTIDPRDYEGRLDCDLAALIPENLRVIRCRAWSAKWTRLFGVGDLGIRSFQGLYVTCRDLLARERFDIIFVTTLPSYPAALGPILKKQFKVPFVLDFQDPWVGAWGLKVGAGPDGRPDVKSRFSRLAGRALEKFTLGAADAITAVSQMTYEEVRARNPVLRNTRCLTIPLGSESADFVRLSARPRPNPYFDHSDGRVHICYVGTLLPLGLGTLRAVLEAVALMRNRRPDLHRRLRLHFFGTSNQTSPTAPKRVVPIAQELGVADSIDEIAPRLPYMDALTVQTQASAVLMMGSSERHYTASKLYPALLARRPVLAVYHEDSTVTDVLRDVARPPTARLVTYNDLTSPADLAENVYEQLAALVESPTYRTEMIDIAALEEYSAKFLAGRLAQLFSEITEPESRLQAGQSLSAIA